MAVVSCSANETYILNSFPAKKVKSTSTSTLSIFVKSDLKVDQVGLAHFCGASSMLKALDTSSMLLPNG